MSSSSSVQSAISEYLLPRPDEIRSRMGNHPAVYIDSSWHLPDSNRNARAEYQSRRIPGAYFFNLGEVKDIDNPLPHMLPSLSQFEAAMKKWNIKPGQSMIFYDNAEMMSSSRAWFTFAVFNIPDIYILNGGLPLWISKGLPVDTDSPSSQDEHSKSQQPFSFQRNLIRTLDEMKENLETRDAQVVDARPYPRFSGQKSEPRQGLRCGHIPGSANVPWTSILSRTNGFPMFESKDVIRQRFIDAGVEIDGDRKIILTCGSGVTAAVLLVGLRIVGVPLSRLSLYDGSWAEWGDPKLCLPIEEGSGTEQVSKM